MTWHPTLSSIERKTDRPQDRPRPRPRPLTDTQRRESAPSTQVGAWEECWCGQPYQHNWPGKGDGAAHPRNRPEIAA